MPVGSARASASTHQSASELFAERAKLFSLPQDTVSRATGFLALPPGGQGLPQSPREQIGQVLFCSIPARASASTPTPIHFARGARHGSYCNKYGPERTGFHNSLGSRANLRAGIAPL